MKFIVDASEIEYMAGTNSYPKNPNDSSNFDHSNLGKFIDALSMKQDLLQRDFNILQQKVWDIEIKEREERELREKSKPSQAVWEKYQFTKDMVTDVTKE